MKSALTPRNADEERIAKNAQRDGFTVWELHNADIKRAQAEREQTLRGQIGKAANEVADKYQWPIALVMAVAGQSVGFLLAFLLFKALQQTGVVRWIDQAITRADQKAFIRDAMRQQLNEYRQQQPISESVMQHMARQRHAALNVTELPLRATTRATTTRTNATILPFQRRARRDRTAPAAPQP